MRRRKTMIEVNFSKDKRFIDHNWNRFFFIGDNGVEYDYRADNSQLAEYLSRILIKDYIRERKGSGISASERIIARSAIKWLLYDLILSDMLDIDSLVEENEKLIKIEIEKDLR